MPECLERMLECWNAGMLECWNAGMPGMPAACGAGLECWNAGMLARLER